MGNKGTFQPKISIMHVLFLQASRKRTFSNKSRWMWTQPTRTIWVLKIHPCFAEAFFRFIYNTLTYALNWNLSASLFLHMWCNTDDVRYYCFPQHPRGTYLPVFSSQQMLLCAGPLPALHDVNFIRHPCSHLWPNWDMKWLKGTKGQSVERWMEDKIFIGEIESALAPLCSLLFNNA